jgi:hypothetical protein
MKNAGRRMGGRDSGDGGDDGAPCAPAAGRGGSGGGGGWQLEKSCGRSMVRGRVRIEGNRPGFTS